MIRKEEVLLKIRVVSIYEKMRENAYDVKRLKVCILIFVQNQNRTSMPLYMHTKQDKSTQLQWYNGSKMYYKGSTLQCIDTLNQDNYVLGLGLQDVLYSNRTP